jgi:hypothetical protein
MFANATLKVDISQRVVATLVASAMVMMSVGFFTTAQAANLVAVSDTLSDSDLGATSAHTIAFTIPAGSSIVSADTVTITFPDGVGEFDEVDAVQTNDVTVTVNGGTDAHTGFVAASSNISFAGIDAAAGQEVVVAIADGIIENPTTLGSYEIVVETAADTGKTQVAIIDNVLVTAIVETQFQFTISGFVATSTVNGLDTTGTTTATLMDFGILTANNPKMLAQRLNVTSNSNNGFTVTVEQDSNLESANGADIDGFIDGLYTNTPSAWVAPDNDIGDENTWGHWGLTSSDDINANEFAGGFVAASTTPREIFHHNGPADGVTLGAGQADIAYRIQISPLQEAADDYNTTLTYIATPTF